MTIKSTVPLLPLVASTAIGAGVAYLYWRGNRRAAPTAEPLFEGKTEAEALAEACGFDEMSSDPSSGIYSAPPLDEVPEVDYRGLSDASFAAALADTAEDLDPLTTDITRPTDRPESEAVARMTWQDVVEVDIEIDPNEVDEIDIDLLDTDREDDEDYSALSPAELGAAWLARATQTRSTPPEARDSNPGELDPAGRPTDPDIESGWPGRNDGLVGKDVWGGPLPNEKEDKA